MFLLQYLIRCLEINTHVGDMVYRLPIDTKSLYLNIRNDNEAGHTATVATPLKQGGSYKRDLGKIMDIPENVDVNSRDGLINYIITRSRAEVVIPKICLFDRISVNGERVDTDSCYCIYVREEISTTNIHYGRQKVHYPISLSFIDENICVDNKKVIKAISEKLSNYAFLVNAFEYDVETKILNFDVTIVGPENIPYSRVFVNQKGTGSKYIKAYFESLDNYDTEIIALREKMGYNNVGVENYIDTINLNKLTALSEIKRYLEKNECDEIRLISLSFPYALYDVEYLVNNTKHFALIKCTATKAKRFVLSAEEIAFCNRFQKEAELFLLTDILEGKKVFHFKAGDLSAMKKRIRNVMYDAGDLAK